MGTCFGDKNGSVEEIMFKVILLDEEVLWLWGKVEPKRRTSTFKAWRGRLLWGRKRHWGPAGSQSLRDWE